MVSCFITDPQIKRNGHSVGQKRERKRILVLEMCILSLKPRFYPVAQTLAPGAKF